MKAEEIWQAALGELQLEMTRATFDTWVKPTSLVSYQAGEMVIATPNQYAQEWLSKRLCSTVNRVLTGITGRSMQATFVVWKAPVKARDVLRRKRSNRFTRTWSPTGPGGAFRIASSTRRWLIWIGRARCCSRPTCATMCDRCAEFLNAGIGLHLYGPNGIGKTHLVIGLAKQVCLELGWTIEFITWRGYLAGLREGYEQAQQRYGDAEPEYRVLQRLVDVDLLVLDDLRADDLTPWARGKLLDLIARRYDAERPLFVTTNYDLNELTYPGANRLGHDEAAISRLLGMCQYLTLQGEDYRLLERRARVSGLKPSVVKPTGVRQE